MTVCTVCIYSGCGLHLLYICWQHAVRGVGGEDLLEKCLKVSRIPQAAGFVRGGGGGGVQEKWGKVSRILKRKKEI